MGGGERETYSGKEREREQERLEEKASLRAWDGNKKVKYSEYRRRVDTKN